MAGSKAGDSAEYLAENWAHELAGMSVVATADVSAGLRGVYWAESLAGTMVLSLVGWKAAQRVETSAGCWGADWAESTVALSVRHWADRLGA